MDQPEDNALYLRAWAADIRKHNGKSVDADRLDSIAAEIERLRSLSLEGREPSELDRLRNEKAAGEFWRGVFDGITDKSEREKIEAELADFHFMMEQVPKVYENVTGGLLTKTNYYAYAVIAAADDYTNNLIEEAVSERLADASPLLPDGYVMGWQDISTAPRNREIAGLTKAGRLVRMMWTFLGDDAVGWGAVEEDMHPKCWTDGFCWEVNADEEPSDPPIMWAELPRAMLSASKPDDKEGW